MMTLSRRTIGVLLAGAGACLLAGPAVVRIFAHPGPGVPLSGAPARGAHTALGAGARNAKAALGADAQSARAARQDQAPNRREFTVVARDYRFTPSRLEVSQNDLVKLTVHSEDHAYSVTIDEYRVSKRVPAGGATTLEFRADRTGTFSYYSNMTSDSRHAGMRGELVVRPR